MEKISKQPDFLDQTYVVNDKDKPRLAQIILQTQDRSANEA